MVFGLPGGIAGGRAWLVDADWAGSRNRVNDTPLPDVMAEYSDTGNPESYERFPALFRASVLGFVAVGEVEQNAQGQTVAGNNLGAARRPMVTDTVARKGIPNSVGQIPTNRAPL